MSRVLVGIVLVVGCLLASQVSAQDGPGGNLDNTGMDAAFFQLSDGADFPNQRVTVTTVILPGFFRDSVINPLHEAPEAGDFVLIQLYDVRMGKVAQKVIELKRPADIPLNQIIQTEKFTVDLPGGNAWGDGGLKVRIVWPQNGSPESGLLQLGGNGWAISDNSIEESP